MSASAQGPVGSTSATALRSSPVPRGQLRTLFAIDERDAVIRMAQTGTGKLLIFVLAMVAVASRLPWWESAWVVSAAMAAARLPKLRTPILLTATWGAAFLEMGLSQNHILADIGVVLQQENVTRWSTTVLASSSLLIVMFASWLALSATRRYPQSFLARRPLVTLLLVEVVLCGLSTSAVTHGLMRAMLWSMLVVLTPYVWFLPFAIMDQRSREPSPPLLQMALLRPFWSPANLPFGKGSALLRKTLAKTPRDLSITQLKAVKLLVWSNVLFGMQAAMAWAGEHLLKIPSLPEAIDAFLNGHAHPIASRWLALILEVATYSLNFALWAALFIGIARLAGYRLPRGSWRPLQSRTLMDYFNRFHYYFKELLVDLFFMPTFFTLFKRHPRLRMFFATFMAAGVGNAIWHFFYEIRLVATLGLANALETYTSYVFYCVVLATGIGLSQVRANMGIRPPSTPLGRAYSFLFVWSFVVCLHVFGDGSRNHTLNERGRFLASLFGVF